MTPVKPTAAEVTPHYQRNHLLMANRSVTASSTAVRYRIIPADPDAHLFRVALHIAKPEPNGQRLALPAWIPGSYMIREFARHVVTLSAHRQGKPVPCQKVDKHTWQLTASDGPVEVDYLVYAYDQSVRTAYLDAHRVFFNPSSLCLRVVGQEHQACTLLLEPPAIPDATTWKVATTLPEADAERYGFGSYLAPDYDALIDHPIEMGPMTVGAFNVAGARHEVAISGCSDVDVARLTRDLKPICATHAALFEPTSGRAPFGRYLFLTHAVDEGYGGLEHRSSTALLCRRHDLPWRAMPHAHPGYLSFLGLASHEYLHAWLVKRIKPAAFVSYDLDRENYTSQLWVFEGFTSYYDELTLARAGVIDAATYLQSLGHTISRVWATPGRHYQSVADSSFDAWIKYYRQDENSPNSSVSYYAKGSLIALALDLSIRSQTEGRTSLDDVLRLMWTRFGRDFYTRSGAPGPRQIGIPEGAFPELMREATGVTLSPTMKRWITGTVDLPLAKLFKPFGITLTLSAEERTPSLGLRTAQQGAPLAITHAYSGGAAQRAGLAAGDQLVAFDGFKVDATNLKALLSRKQAGDTVQIHAFRRDVLLHREITLDPPSPTHARLSLSGRPSPLQRGWLGAATRPAFGRSAHRAND